MVPMSRFLSETRDSRVGLLVFVVFSLSLIDSRLVDAQSLYTINTVSGAASILKGYTGDGGPASKARLSSPSGIALGPDGTVFIADTDNQVIRAIDNSGTIRTVAGSAVQGYGGDKGPAREAKLLFPHGVAVDSQGNLYIADTMNNRIRRVDKTGIIETFAGSGEAGYSGDGGLAVMAKLSSPDGLVIDRNDVLYFTENGNNTIRKITPDGIISRISRIRSDGSVEVIAGAPSAFDVAKGDGGRAMDAAIPYPTAVAFDTSGNLFIASDRIRRVDKNGLITSVIGAAEDATPLEDGSPLQTRLGSPQAMAFDQRGSLYIADTFRNRVLRFDTTGKLEVVAGLSVLPEEKDGGPAEFAHLINPWAVAIGPRGDLFVADTE